MKTVIIRQPAGLGDILVGQKVAYQYAQRDDVDQVIWPVSYVYSDIGKYLYNKSPKVKFIPETQDFPFKKYYNTDMTDILETNASIYVPLQSADRVCPAVNMLFSKYKLVNMTMDNWMEYFSIKRNLEKENELYEKIVGDIPPQEYCILNTNYGTYPNFIKRKDFKTPRGVKIIDMDFVPGYSLFDWISILTNSVEIFTIETSLCFLLSKLKMRNVTVLARTPHYVSNYPYHYHLVDPETETTWKYER